MRICFEGVSFGFGAAPVFENLNLELSERDSALPVAILGPSGCGKTSLLNLIAGLLLPRKGRVLKDSPSVSFVFQEPRLLPWLTVLENTALQLKKILGKDGAEKRALRFLESVSLGSKAGSFPHELSGGQMQRAALARAFAFPSEVLLMDEPFNSLDIPLRLDLMDTTIRLLSQEKRLALVVTHDPREAIYLGGRIVVLGQPPGGVVFDEKLDLPREGRSYGSREAGEIEKKLIGILARYSALP
ncbi:MAG: ATP-binding cassette domain-containing protein [Treponema sp.]|jgi:NitT/TauT family transport system ATP-binding protein|nr:ATP-binding cassette domain-containing protein [Treponema sp.]